MKNKQNSPVFKTTEVITLVLITCIVSLLMGLIISGSNESLKYELIETDSELQNFVEQYKYIVDNYYGEINKSELLESALKGMVESLDDPYSSYFDKNASSNFNTTLNGSYEGIGVEIINDENKNIIITRVFKDTPAEDAGIKPLDMIVNINGKSISNITTSDFVAMVKEIQSSDFNLGIKRGEENITVTVCRKQVTLSSISSEMFEKNNKRIGYIYISIFAMNTDTQFRTAINQLEQDDMEALIIDLRGNSGGHLTSVENMISEFLDSSNIIYQIETKTKRTVFYSKGKETKKYPIVLLVDGDSASASEMMTAALREAYGATVIGNTTFGKGTVQELQYSNETQYKITTKRWLTPNGNWINDIGIKPDYEIKLSEQYYDNPSNENDNQLQKALEILTN